MRWAECNFSMWSKEQLRKQCIEGQKQIRKLEAELTLTRNQLDNANTNNGPQQISRSDGIKGFNQSN